jgi:hypothetical protein
MKSKREEIEDEYQAYTQLLELMEMEFDYDLDAKATKASQKRKREVEEYVAELEELLKGEL